MEWKGKGNKEEMNKIELKRSKRKQQKKERKGKYPKQERKFMQKERKEVKKMKKGENKGECFYKELNLDSFKLQHCLLTRAYKAHYPAW